jgi:hypothetical protein
MIGGIPTPQDNDLLLQDTVTRTATGNGTALDLGAGFTPGGIGMPASAVIDVSAADRANSDETYNFKLQESSDNSTFVDIGVNTAVTVASTTATLGVYVAKGFITKRYVRLVLTAAGTTPSVTYKAWLNLLQQR